MIIHKSGRIVANNVKPIMFFNTATEYYTWMNSLPNKINDVNKFDVRIGSPSPKIAFVQAANGTELNNIPLDQRDPGTLYHETGYNYSYVVNPQTKAYVRVNTLNGCSCSVYRQTGAEAPWRRNIIIQIRNTPYTLATLDDFKKICQDFMNRAVGPNTYNPIRVHLYGTYYEDNIDTGEVRFWTPTIYLTYESGAVFINFDPNFNFQKSIDNGQTKLEGYPNTAGYKIKLNDITEANGWLIANPRTYGKYGAIA